MKHNPNAPCLPMGNMQLYTHPQPRKIIQTPTIVVILYEGNTGIRQIHTDGRPLPLRQEGDGVTLPISPGRETFKLAWRQSSDGIGMLYRSPAVDLGVPSVNATIEISADSTLRSMREWSPRYSSRTRSWTAASSPTIPTARTRSPRSCD